MHINKDSEPIEKIFFLDYGVGALDKLPVDTVAQRLVDRWPAIDEAYRDGVLTSKKHESSLKKNRNGWQ